LVARSFLPLDTLNNVGWSRRDFDGPVAGSVCGERPARPGGVSHIPTLLMSR
jgi:hypothetical protein